MLVEILYVTNYGKSVSYGSGRFENDEKCINWLIVFLLVILVILVC